MLYLGQEQDMSIQYVVDSEVNRPGFAGDQNL